MVGIIDYGVGNLFSLECSLKSLGQKVFISGDEKILRQADHLLLPGVGAFGDAAQKLRQSGLDSFVTEQAEIGKPLLGICLGMQLLFEKSFEYGEHRGLGLLKGQVVSMEGRIHQKIPHMGWNSLQRVNDRSRLLENIDSEAYVYFVHSYFADGCADSLAAMTEYEIPMTAAVEKNNIFGCQFHPEKSGAVGLRILDTFCRL